jgi:hypothetical protein
MSEKRELRIGDKIRDNDPRMLPRTLEIIDMDVAKSPILRAVAVVPGTKTQGLVRIRLDRIHTDGKPRRSGWSLVPC